MQMIHSFDRVEQMNNLLNVGGRKCNFKFPTVCVFFSDYLNSSFLHLLNQTPKYSDQSLCLDILRHLPVKYSIMYGIPFS